MHPLVHHRTHPFVFPCLGFVCSCNHIGLVRCCCRRYRHSRFPCAPSQSHMNYGVSSMRKQDYATAADAFQATLQRDPYFRGLQDNLKDFRSAVELQQRYGTLSYVVVLSASRCRSNFLRLQHPPLTALAAVYPNSHRQRQGRAGTTTPGQGRPRKGQARWRASC